MNFDVTIELWQERVIDERNELETRLYLLNKFMTSSKFQDIPYDDQVRLQKQKDAMTVYAQALADRIVNFYPGAN